MTYFLRSDQNLREVLPYVVTYVKLCAMHDFIGDVDRAPVHGECS
jgi:hypothetical protein